MKLHIMTILYRNQSRLNGGYKWIVVILLFFGAIITKLGKNIFMISNKKTQILAVVMCASNIIVNNNADIIIKDDSIVCYKDI